MWFLRAFGHVIGQTVNTAVNTHTYTHRHYNTHKHMFLENLVMDTSAINVTLGQYEFRKDKYKPP